jgi:uncharacterized protein with ACT and thioredoxin-like domain
MLAVAAVYMSGVNNPIVSTFVKPDEHNYRHVMEIETVKDLKNILLRDLLISLKVLQQDLQHHVHSRIAGYRIISRMIFLV